MRIIAGEMRGRKLRCPKEGTRPTLDRVREALFSILGNIEGETVVDLYSGSGALGLEAVSRGAKQAVMVEADARAAKVIEMNVSTLGVTDRCSVLRAEVEKSRGPLGRFAPYDLVLADPPWAIAPEAMRAIARLTRGLLHDDARIVIGHRSNEPLVPAEDLGLVLSDTRRWGDSGLSFFSRTKNT